MNGILKTGLEFWQLIVAIVVVVFSIVAIKISLNFDLNKYLESRRKSYTQKLKSACTHVELSPGDDGKMIQARHLYISPPGTIQWHCQRCGHVAYRQGDEFEK